LLPVDVTELANIHELRAAKGSIDEWNGKDNCLNRQTGSNR